MTNLFFIPATGHLDGFIYYVQILRESDGYIWDGAVMAASPDYTATEVALDEINSMGVWSLAEVPSDLPVGTYMVIGRRRATASPAAATDDIVGEPKRIKKKPNGSVVVL
jgi:hypothetical protein